MTGEEISTGLNDYHFRIRSATDTATVAVVFLQFAVRKKKKDQAGWSGGVKCESIQTSQEN